MREIKFRIVCKDASGNVFFEFVDLWTLMLGRFNVENIGRIEAIVTKDQYTGLKDKNGKEIFEGDIVRAQFYDSKPETMKVEWFDVHYYIGIAGGYPLSISGLHDIEIIGNVYENKDLIGAEK